MKLKIIGHAFVWQGGQYEVYSKIGFDNNLMQLEHNGSAKNSEEVIRLIEAVKKANNVRGD